MCLNVHEHVKGKWLVKSLFDRSVCMHRFHARNVYVVIVRMTRNLTSGNKNAKHLFLACWLRRVMGRWCCWETRFSFHLMKRKFRVQWLHSLRPFTCWIWTTQLTGLQVCLSSSSSFSRTVKFIRTVMLMSRRQLNSLNASPSNRCPYSMKQ